jgi:hypothetical protein
MKLVYNASASKTLYKSCSNICDIWCAACLIRWLYRCSAIRHQFMGAPGVPPPCRPERSTTSGSAWQRHVC